MTRERQLKKIQDKLDDDDQKFTDAQAKIEIVAQEKHEVMLQKRECEQVIQELEDQIVQLSLRLKQQEDLVNIARSDRERERSMNGEKVTAMNQLIEKVRKGEVELVSQKRL